MKPKYNLLIKLNTFENLMVRLGDGLRLVLLAYKKIANDNDNMITNEDLLYNILTDYSTFTGKVSIAHFNTYISEYLLTGDIPDMPKEEFSSSQLSYYTCLDEYIFADSLVSLSMLKYFYFELWDILVEQALKNMNNKNSSYDLKIPFKKFSTFYKNRAYNQKYDKDDICAKFLNDLDSFLEYNHILKLKDFEVDEETYDLTIPIQFKFAYLEKY